MPRNLRLSTGGMVYHVLNRANGRNRIFKTDKDYSEFLQLLGAASARSGTRLLAYCLMPNHWHLVLWPRLDGELSECLRWLTVTHTNRWHASHGTTGTGSLYQGRFKSFPVQKGDPLWTVCRYVERNALRAKLVKKAEGWKWGSAYCIQQKNPDGLLSAGPEPRPDDWMKRVNQPQSEQEVFSMRNCVNRGCPYGSRLWVPQTVKKFGLESTLKPRGRPKSA